MLDFIFLEGVDAKVDKKFSGFKGDIIILDKAAKEKAVLVILCVFDDFDIKSKLINIISDLVNVAIFNCFN